MKKFLYLLLCLLPAVGLSSCHDDDKDLPNVDFNLQISGGEISGGEIYAVAGQDLTIDGITVTNNEAGKGVLIPYANYYWDYSFLGQSVEAPYGYNIVIPEDYPLGNHVLEITAPVYAVDKSPAFAVIVYNVVVVASTDDLPDNAATFATVQPRISDTDPSK